MTSVHIGEKVKSSLRNKYLTWGDVETISIPKSNYGYFILLNRRLPVTNIIRRLNKRKLEVSKEKNENIIVKNIYFMT